MNFPYQFREAIQATGLIPPDEIEPGRLHRFPGIGKRGGNTAGWCKLFADGNGGVFGDYSQDISEHWHAERTAPYTPAQREAFFGKVQEAKALAEAEKIAKQSEAAAKAAAIWQAAQPATHDHPYLARKSIKASGAKILDGKLVIPMREGAALHSLQFIGADGLKRFMPDGRKKGCYFSIGNTKGAAALCIAEGFATGATIHEATGLPVAVAFDAGNLESVALAMLAKLPDLPLILCADDDAGTDGNPGVTKATAAARAVHGKLAIPNFGVDKPEGASDFNDLAAHCGKNAVQRAIAGASIPAMPTHPPDAEKATLSVYANYVELLRGSEVNPEPVNWLWHGWLAAGKMHVLGGAPGTGKTTISMALSATVTTGGRWPDGARSPAGNVVIWSGEDDPADTLIPRLALSGADLSRVYFIADVREGNERRSFDPARDMEVLRRKLAELGDVRLLIVDPIVSAIAGDSHKNAEVRRGLQPLADLAASMRCALLGITHFSKGTGGRDPVERLTGSLAFGALARVVLVAAKHQEEGDDGRTVRLLLRAKSNIGPDDGGFEYDLQQGELKTHPGIFASSVLWGKAVEGAARELLATADAASEDVGGDNVASAASWLSDLLTEEGGRLDRRDVMRAAHSMGHKERTVHRARKKVGLIVRQSGFGKEKRSLWTWPDSPMPAPIVPIMPNKLSGTHGTNGGTHEGNAIVEVEI